MAYGAVLADGTRWFGSSEFYVGVAGGGPYIPARYYIALPLVGPATPACTVTIADDASFGREPKMPVIETYQASGSWYLAVVTGSFNSSNSQNFPFMFICVQ